MADKISNQCCAIKRDGKRCTNTAKPGFTTCGIAAHRKQQTVATHAPDAPDEAPSSSKKEELPAKTKYTNKKVEITLAINSKNDSDIIEAIRERQQKGPTLKDCPGYIYIYYKRDDTHKNMYKVGRTHGLPERRVARWGGTLITSYPVKRHKFAEIMIHLYLDYCRKKRTTRRAGKIHEEIEWFQEDLAEVQRVCKEIVKEINLQFADAKWPPQFAGIKE